MSDFEAERQPAQATPVESASRADPLAGDWSEGLPGPVREHGLPVPQRLGEVRLPPSPPPEESLRAIEAPSSEAAQSPVDPSWSMAPPANSDSPWAIAPPAPATEDWAAGPPSQTPAGDDLWSAPAAADVVADWAAAPPPQKPPARAPSSAVPQDSSWSAPPPAAGGELTPEVDAPRWSESSKPEFAPLPPGESLAAEDEYAPRAVDETEAANLLRPVIEDASALLRPVEGAANQAPPPAQAAKGSAVASGVAPPGELVPGEHRVAIHARGGRTRRGTVTDVDLSRPQFALQPQGGGAAETVDHAELKAIFFMLAPGEAALAPSGRKVRVTFSDGRSIEGHRDGADLRQGFFLIPLDAQKTNTKRIYVAKGAVTSVTNVG